MKSLTIKTPFCERLIESVVLVSEEYALKVTTPKPTVTTFECIDWVRVV